MIRGNQNIKNIHMVGIAGSGMSGIAEILVSLGYSVQGSDINLGKTRQYFKDLGITFFCEHDAGNLDNVDLVVYSGAIDKSNIELVTASNKNIPILRRAEMLADLMSYRFGIAVSGSHGKTTTTSMVAHILTYAGMDPTYVIGGQVMQFSSHARLGQSEYLVVEADESDGSFIHMKPKIAVITNIEDDHLDHYNYSMDDLIQGFRDFVQNIPFDGLILANGDDLMVRTALKDIGRKILFYGRLEENELVIKRHQFAFNTTTIELIYKGNELGPIKIKTPGQHNVFNAVAAVAVALSLGIDWELIQNALTEFNGIKRRFEFIGAYKINKFETVIYSDYAHHPTEIAVTIETAKEVYPEKDIVTIFQPHRYSRTAMLKDKIAEALSKSNKILLLDIYGAGEKNNLEVTSKDIVDVIDRDFNGKDIFLVGIDEIEKTIDERLQKDSVLLFMGAGEINLIAEDYVKFNEKKACVA